MDKKEEKYSLEDLDDIEEFDDLEDLDSISELDDLLEELDDEQTDEKSLTDYDSEDANKQHSEYIDDEKEDSTFKQNDKFSNNKTLIAKILVPIIFLLVIVLLLIKGCSSNNSYTIKFDTDGGTKITSQKVKANDKVDIPTDPVKEGYTFLGWYLDGKKYDFDDKVTANIVLEARWEIVKTAKVTGVTLDQTSVTILPGNSVLLVATVEPSDAKDSNIIWTSSNEKIATVDSNGNVKAISLGTVVITAITTDGNYKAACSVTVSENVVNVTDISFSKSNLELNTNDVVSLTATITPVNATNKGIIWTSSNNKVVKVVNGKVTAMAEGTAIITATTKDGEKTATVNVTVKDVPVTGIAISPTILNMTIGDKAKQLVATIAPINASNKGVTWKSSNNSIASVDSKGKVTAVGVGTTTITATTKDGGKIATVTINVSKPIEASSVSVSGPTSVVEGKTIILSALVKPNNTVNKAIKWSSSDTSIATVNSNGVVSGIKSGEVTITATTANGKFATHNVIVTEKPASYAIVFTPYEQEGTGSVLQYTYTVTKNSVVFKDYSKIGITGGGVLGTYPDKNTVMKAKSSGVTIILNDGTKVSANVTIKN